MKKIISFFTTVLLCTELAYGESVRISKYQPTNQDNDTAIETGDSELRLIKQDEKEVSFFVGANLIGGAPFYTDYDFLNEPFGFGWGIDGGVKFRKNKYIYHPGIKISYQQLSNSGEYDVGYYYDFVNLDVSHSLFSVAFENHIRIAHNEPSIFGGHNVNDFLVFDLGIGKINSEYELSDYSTSLEDEGKLYMLGLGYYSQFDNGLGITFDTKYYFPDNETVSIIITMELGLRYTF